MKMTKYLFLTANEGITIHYSLS